MEKSDLLSIGEVASRTGLAVSAVRFYADEGLIRAKRNGSGHRVFERGEIRRITFVAICQQLGYSLAEIAKTLGSLPHGRTPTSKDWQRLAGGFTEDLDDRITKLTELRDRLTGCIGCGCLSMEACQLYNADDRARSGPGAAFVR